MMPIRDRRVSMLSIGYCPDYMLIMILPLSSGRCCGYEKLVSVGHVRCAVARRHGYLALWSDGRRRRTHSSSDSVKSSRMHHRDYDVEE